MSLELNQSNYFSLEADREYFSVSQFKGFVECQAKAVAKLKGEHEESFGKALVVGSYTHAAFESDHEFEKFTAENTDEIFNRSGNKYADFITADAMIGTVKNDKFAMFAMDGEKEIILTAELFGVKWKAKIDSINHTRNTFTDLKTTRSLSQRYWSDKYQKYVSFIEAWDYVLQMAMYREIIQANTGSYYSPYVVAVTKEDPPDKAVLHFDDTRFQFELDYVEHKIDQFAALKAGEVEPTRCEKCAYCRKTKQLKDTIEIGELV
ncbi:PD-(D/E)XK nuclease-like domain-containing protein [Sporosarcina sp. NPDC096371]|uniref:PD-(D/E)XK nuclease-like domain-containing protein n=1 Tax=Sporosarcina sp. NPDC096371 TaxID=3364530 RepID=UPI003814CB8D